MIRVSKGACIIVYQQIAQIVLAVFRLRQMDFLNIPKQLWKWTQSPDIRHPGLNRAFQNIPVLKLRAQAVKLAVGNIRNIKKLSSSFVGQL